MINVAADVKSYILLIIPGWKTSYLNLVTTSETKFESAFAKKGTEATSDLQL